MQSLLESNSHFLSLIIEKRKTHKIYDTRFLNVIERLARTYNIAFNPFNFHSKFTNENKRTKTKGKDTFVCGDNCCNMIFLNITVLDTTQTLIIHEKRLLKKKCKTYAKIHEYPINFFIRLRSRFPIEPVPFSIRRRSLACVFLQDEYHI